MTTSEVPQRPDEIVEESLIDALVAIADDLDVGATLRRTVRASRALTGARYAALGVLDDEGEALAQFIHEGLDEETASRLGALPTGRGLLGELIRRPRALRVDDVADHPASVELPAGHPPVEGFVGVPVRVGGRVFGNLYLTGKPGGFTVEDERLLQALATVAGSAIRNAGDAASLAARALLQRALADLATAVLAGADRHELLAVLEVAASSLLPGATAGVVTPGRELRQVDEERLWWLPLDDDGDTALVVDTAEASPWRVTADARAALDTLARQAGVAVRWADARAEVRRLAVRGERDRIARDLHDTVIQRLFGAGLQLDALTRRSDDGLAAELERVIAEVDAAIAELRGTIGELDAPPALDVRDRLDAVVAALAPACPELGELVVEGDLDDLPPDLVSDVAAVLREAISNAARHASASTIEPVVEIGPETVTVLVTDDGRGPGDAHDVGRTPGSSLGLRNLQARATGHGGTSRLVAIDPRGARFEWQVPLD